MRAPLTLDDVLKDLLWPRLLRSASLALNASRIGLAMAIVVSVMLLDSLGIWLASEKGTPSPKIGIIADSLWEIKRLATSIATSGTAGDISNGVKQLYDLFVLFPLDTVQSRPWHTLLVIVPAIAITAVLGGAICRSAACESAVNVRLTWMQSLGFAISKWSSLLGATLGPLVMIWLVAGALWILGWGFKVVALDIAASLAMGLGLLAAFVAALGMLVYFFGQSMLIPGVACEGSDGFDSVQRAYAYTIARPGRLAIYSLIVIAQGLIAIGIAFGLVTLATMLAVGSAGLSGFFTSLPGIGGLSAAEPTGTLHIGLSIVRFFVLVLFSVAGAYGVSFYFSACTQLYLVMRQLVDGQDIGELWMPGVIESTMARADGPTPLTTGASFTDAGVSKLDRGGGGAGAGAGGTS
jgi:hypothetical protein